MVLLQDVFTRYVEVSAVPRINAETIAQVIFVEWIRRYGPMRRLLSDNGTEFKNELVVKGLCDLCGVEKIFTTAHHPQSNGMVERLVRTVKQLLVAQMDSLPGSWDDRVPLIQFAYNHTVHTGTGEVPYYLWYGRPPVALPTLLAAPEQLDTAQSVREYRDSLWRRLVIAFELVREHQRQENNETNETRRERARIETWEVGDLAWVHRPNTSNDFNSRKMYNPWTGPGQILHVFSRTRLEVLLPARTNPRRTFVVHPDRLRRYLVPFHQPWQREGQAMRFPLALIRKKLRHGEAEYLVSWLSVVPTADSWERADKLPVHLTETFEARLRLRSRETDDVADEIAEPEG